ncbi:IS200/IS605 family transposase, partial [Roseibium sp. RKSG952]|uniref:IS200/IS605 family transposase n=1 Tax=Roseibium sp. RKSG952 TaxID=2529384 RepID=UPI0034CE1E3E
MTKYRKPILHGELGHFLRDTIRRTCAEMNIQILEGVISKDHVHLFVSAPPSLSVSQIMQKVKGRSSYKAMQQFPRL